MLKLQITTKIRNTIQNKYKNKYKLLQNWYDVVLFCLLGLLLFSLFIFELIAVITATVKASKGELYKYPLSIPFIKTESQVITSESQENSSEKKIRK